jgi:hypothetical protein
LSDDLKYAKSIKRGQALNIQKRFIWTS